MDTQDVERIVRDVLTAHGADLSIVSVARVDIGWRLTLKNGAGREFLHTVPSTLPARVRADFTQWLEMQD